MKASIFTGAWITPEQDAKLDELSAVCRCSKSALWRQLIDLAELTLVPGVRLASGNQGAGGDDVS